jgi:hypothetical protein
MSTDFKSFEDFWPFYVCEHSKPLTRTFHFIGTATIVPLFIVAVIYNGYLVFLVPVCAYGFAWFGHYVIENNRPATFRHPLWSLLGDFKMFAFILIGKMSKEVSRCQGLRSNS